MTRSDPHRRDKLRQRATQPAPLAGEEWSPDEVELALRATTVEEMKEVARAIGRTYYAVADKRNAVRTGRCGGGAPLPPEQRGLGPHEFTCQGCFTVLHRCQASASEGYCVECHPVPAGAERKHLQVAV